MDDRPRIEQAARIEEIEALKERAALLEKENAALLQKLNGAKVEQQADKISESQAARDVFAALALDGAGSCGPRDPRVSVWERAFSGIFDALAEIKDEDWRNSCGPGTADPYAKKVALRLKNLVVSERRHRDRANALAQQLTEKSYAKSTGGPSCSSYRYDG
ncbi:MAG: hypothetical protein GXY74_03020 [Phycisphaerae bacterium]|nr:hypothetical protein [Phycisphaerae bacterium]